MQFSSLLAYMNQLKLDLHSNQHTLTPTTPSPACKFPSLGKICVVEITAGHLDEKAKQVDSNSAKYSEQWIKHLSATAS